MKKIQHILVVGGKHGQTLQRIHAFEAMGYQVDCLSTTPTDYAPGITYTPSFADRVRHKLGLPRDKQKINQRIIHFCQSHSVDMLWVENVKVLKPKTLQRLKRLNIYLAWYSGDNICVRANQSYYLCKGLPLYDIVFTTKSYNCNPEELPAMGANNIVFVDKGYDPNRHAPLVLSQADREHYANDVGFIGTYEYDRAQSMLYLAKHGIRVRIWGNGWAAWQDKHPLLNIENKPIYDDEYQKAINATKINLCFLRKLNYDLQTDRSIEIPACGAFMLAERTDEHQRLFTEDVEAAFFDNHNPQELLEKVKYYLAHEEKRRAIAKAGLLRCEQSDYSHQARLRYMMARIDDALQSQSVRVD